MSAAMQKVGGTGLRRFKPYPEYKDSGVEWLGKIPAHWACSRLRYVTHLNPIKTEVRDLDPLLPVSFVPMEAVGEYGGLRLDAVKPLAATRDGFTYFRDGDVIVAKITPCFENGKGALALGLENGIAFGTTELHVLRARPGADARFVFYVTLSDHFRRLGASTMYGAGGQKRISEEFILNLRHPLPSELEQRAIAAFLDCETARIDALVAKKERLIELLQEKRAALITRAVTKGLDPNVPMKDSGVEWLGEIPAHWDVWSVRNLLRRRFVQVQDGNHGELHPIAEDYVPAGIPFLMATDIHGGRIDLVGCHFIAKAQADKLRIGFAKPGDVLLTHKGTIGATAIVPEAIDSPYIMLTPQVTYYRVIPEMVGAEFLHLQFQSDAFQEQMRILAEGGTTRAYLGVVAQRELRLVVPPPDEQREISDNLSSVLMPFDQLVGRVRDAINLLKELRAALISAAVTGKIDVRASDAG